MDFFSKDNVSPVTQICLGIACASCLLCKNFRVLSCYDVIILVTVVLECTMIYILYVFSILPLLYFQCIT